MLAPLRVAVQSLHGNETRPMQVADDWIVVCPENGLFFGRGGSRRNVIPSSSSASMYQSAWRSVDGVPFGRELAPKHGVSITCFAAANDFPTNRRRAVLPTWHAWRLQRMRADINADPSSVDVTVRHVRNPAAAAGCAGRSQPVRDDEYPAAFTTVPTQVHYRHDHVHQAQ